MLKILSRLYKQKRPAMAEFVFFLYWSDSKIQTLKSRAKHRATRKCRISPALAMLRLPSRLGPAQGTRYWVLQKCSSFTKTSQCPSVVTLLLLPTFTTKHNNSIFITLWNHSSKTYIMKSKKITMKLESISWMIFKNHILKWSWLFKIL